MVTAEASMLNKQTLPLFVFKLHYIAESNRQSLLPLAPVYGSALGSDCRDHFNFNNYPGALLAIDAAALFIAGMNTDAR